MAVAIRIMHQEGINWAWLCPQQLFSTKMGNSIVKRAFKNLTEGLYLIRHKRNKAKIAYVQIFNPKYNPCGFWTFDGVITKSCSKDFNITSPLGLMCWSKLDYWELLPIKEELAQVLYGTTKK